MSSFPIDKFANSPVAESTGQFVRIGEQIGVSGNRGQSSGLHLHFELRTDVATVMAIDPAPFIVAEMPSIGGLVRAEITIKGD